MRLLPEFIKPPAARASYHRSRVGVYRSAFNVQPSQLTARFFYNYSGRMDADMKSLDSKIGELVQLCQRLREDNQHLRQQLAASVSATKRLEEKVNIATTRLESLLARLPAQDEA